MRRTMSGGGGGAGGFNMPPFAGAVRWLIIANVAVFIVQSVLQGFAPGGAALFYRLFALVPEQLLSGWIWQVLTYAFLHGDVMHIFFNMLMLWMFGASMQSYFGKRQFYEFYYFCVLGSALVFTVMTFAGAFGLRPTAFLVGASGGIFGLLIAFGVVYAESHVYLFPFPIAIKAKYLCGIWLGINVLLMIRNENPGSAIAHLGGAFFGYLYLKFLPRQGFGFSFSERWYAMRNAYHRYQRKQAMKKFKVYMREHDRGDYFDEHGNYKDPDSKKGNGEAGKGPWVN